MGNMRKVNLVNNPCQQLELFAGLGIEEPTIRDDPAFIKALAFFEEHFCEVTIDGKVRRGFLHTDLMGFLKAPYKDGRNWWRDQCKKHNLKANKHFWVFREKTLPKIGRGRPEKHYLVPPHIAREIIGTDAGLEAKQIREALWALAERYRDSDPEMVREMMERTSDPVKIEQALLATRERYWRYYLSIGKSPEWIEDRLKWMPPRTDWTDILKQRDVGKRAYGEGTNRVYKAILGMKADEIRAARNIPDNRPARDGCSQLELAKVALAEILVTEALRADETIQGRACLTVCSEEAAKLRDIRPGKN
jgi:hypothetical protein